MISGGLAAGDGEKSVAEPGYDYVVRNSSIIGRGDVGMQVHGASVNAEGNYFAGNKGGNVKVTDAERARFVDNEFE